MELSWKQLFVAKISDLHNVRLVETFVKVSLQTFLLISNSKQINTINFRVSLWQGGR